MALPMLLRPTASTLRLPLATSLGIASGLTLFAASQSLFAPRQNLLLRCDSSPAAAFSSSARQEYQSYQRDAQTPVTTKSGRLNPKAVRQISAGSICGLLGGLAVSVFSKPLAVLIGLMVFGVQACESRGIHLIPYGRLQNIFRGTDVKSAIRDNVAFKLCFGATFALAAFAEF